MYKYIYFEEIDSTNEYLKREYKNLKDKTIVFTSHQSKGKGRLGRSWVDDKNSLIFSILLIKNIKNPTLISLLSGASLLITLEKMGFKPMIKWPNDVLLNEKKCAGILVEGITSKTLDAIIIGIGINLNDTHFEKEIETKAISLHQVSKKLYDKKVVLTNFIEEFDKLYTDFIKDGREYLNIIKTHSYLDGKEIYLNYYGEDKKVTVKHINDDGSLSVIDKGNELSISSGEVTLEKNY